MEPNFLVQFLPVILFVVLCAFGFPLQLGSIDISVFPTCMTVLVLVFLSPFDVFLAADCLCGVYCRAPLMVNYLWYDVSGDVLLGQHDATVEIVFPALDQDDESPKLRHTSALDSHKDFIMCLHNQLLCDQNIHTVLIRNNCYFLCKVFSLGGWNDGKIQLLKMNHSLRISWGVEMRDK